MEQESEYQVFKAELGTIGLKIGDILLKMDYYEQKEESDLEESIIEISRLKKIYVYCVFVQKDHESVYF